MRSALCAVHSLAVVHLKLTSNDRVDDISALEKVFALHGLLYYSVLRLENVLRFVGASPIQEVADGE